MNSLTFRPLGQGKKTHHERERDMTRDKLKTRAETVIAKMAELTALLEKEELTDKEWRRASDLAEIAKKKTDALEFYIPEMATKETGGEDWMG